jgi:hypothetical protein
MDAEPRDNQLRFYSTADRKNIALAKQQFILDLCLVDAFPSKVDAMARATEALVAAEEATGHGASLFRPSYI